MRKTVSIILTILFFCLSAQAAVPFEQLLYKGRAVPFYNDSNNTEQQKFLDGVKGAHLAERMATLVSSSLMLKNDIGVGFESCGQMNAYFNPQRRAIVICSEFVELMLKTAREDQDFMMKLPRDKFGGRLTASFGEYSSTSLPMQSLLRTTWQSRVEKRMLLTNFQFGMPLILWTSIKHQSSRPPSGFGAA